jgi:hypothetical protein
MNIEIEVTSFIMFGPTYYIMIHVHAYIYNIISITIPIVQIRIVDGILGWCYDLIK